VVQAPGAVDDSGCLRSAGVVAPENIEDGQHLDSRINKLAIARC
jgi:hypothetical protein